RDIAKEAYPGDNSGLYDTGKYAIGDTFTLGKKKTRHTGIPSFSPDLFMRVTAKDPMKAKHLEKGVAQLSEEGATQLFIRRTTNEKLLGAVGSLQFEVVKYRLEDEYSVPATYEPVPWEGVRWLKFKDKKQEDQFCRDYSSVIMEDSHGRICYAV